MLVDCQQTLVGIGSITMIQPVSQWDLAVGVMYVGFHLLTLDCGLAQCKLESFWCIYTCVIIIAKIIYPFEGMGISQVIFQKICCILQRIKMSQVCWEWKLNANYRHTGN